MHACYHSPKANCKPKWASRITSGTCYSDGELAGTGLKKGLAPGTATERVQADVLCIAQHTVSHMVCRWCQWKQGDLFGKEMGHSTRRSQTVTGPSGPGLLSNAMIHSKTKSNLGKKGFFDLQMTLRFWGRPRQERKQRPRRNSDHRLALHGLFRPLS